MEFEQPNAQRRKRGADGKKKKSKTSEERKEKRGEITSRGHRFTRMKWAAGERGSA